MNLNDARRLAIRQRMNIRFTLNNGYEGLIDEHGIARIPALASPPDFTLSDQFGLVEQFTIEPVAGKPGVDGRRRVSRVELAEMAAATGGGAAAAHDHEE